MCSGSLVEEIIEKLGNWILDFTSSYIVLFRTFLNIGSVFEQEPNSTAVDTILLM